MTYTALAVLAVPLAVLIDLFVLRTRLTRHGVWWLSYLVVLGFQLLTNGWLTGRAIVRYNPDAIIGGAQPQLWGNGRVVFAPVEDLGFGFALVLLSCATWTWLGRARGADGDRLE